MAADDLFKALADPTRREILKLLRAQEMTAGDIANRFDVSKPSMSHHFSVLKSARLIESRREGPTIFYRLNATVVHEFVAWIMDLADRKDERK